MSKASLLESGSVGAIHNAKKTDIVISITCTAPLFIIANKTHMHTHCSRENVAHKITPLSVSLRSVVSCAYCLDLTGNCGAARSKYDGNVPVPSHM